MLFNKSVTDKYIHSAKGLFYKNISSLFAVYKTIRPVIRNRIMNVFYAGVVALAFILSLIKNNDVSASVSPKDKLDYLILENSIDFYDETSSSSIQAASVYPQSSIENIRSLTEMVRYEDTIKTVEQEIVLQKGDTFIKLLTDLGLSYNQAHEIYLILKPVYKPESLRAGQILHITTKVDTQKDELISLENITFEPRIGQKFVVEKDENNAFHAKSIKDDLIQEFKSVSGSISGNLSSSMNNAGVPNKLVAEFINIFSYSIDFRRDIKKGDRFEIIFENYITEEGKTVKSGNILYAALQLRKDKIALYRFKDSKGNVDFFDEKGFAMKKTLYRKPLAFQAARISSPFGKRKHPIKKRWIIHWGVDYAAPRGTKIYAAGDGVVQVAKYNGGYGNYVKIRHNSEYSSAYGHMNKIAAGIRPGVRVKQGQVIGYVGSTGLSTGPHLHYEVVRNGKRVNPLTIKAAAGENLTGKSLRTFKANVAELKNTHKTFFAQNEKKQKLAKK